MIETEHYAKARRHLRAAAGLEPPCARTHYLAGLAFEKDPHGDDRRAAVRFKTASELEPQNPLFRALRVDKLTISVLEFVLRAYLQGRVDDIPTWRMLRIPEAQLKARAEAFAKRAGPGIKSLELKSIVGGGSAPEIDVPSWGVTLNFPNLSDTELERRLRSSNPPVIARIENGRVILDFRTIFPGEEDTLLEILRKVGS